MAERRTGGPRHRLAIMRHANSERGGFDTPDRARELTQIGRHRAGDRRGIVQAFRPSLTLCSSAVRTQQTMAELGDAVGDSAVEDALYVATPSSLLERITEVDEGVARLLVIAHMPTVQIVAEGLTGRPQVEAAGGLSFAPGAVAILDLDTPWAALDVGSVSLAAFHP